MPLCIFWLLRALQGIGLTCEEPGQMALQAKAFGKFPPSADEKAKMQRERDKQASK